MKRFFLLILVLLNSYTRGQNLNFRYVDSLSYSLFTQGNWKKLAELDKIKQLKNFDYYLLNVRMGIAFYYLQDYYKSEKYLQKALKKYSTSEVALDYLLGVYVKTNQHLQASVVNEKLPPYIKYKYKYPSKAKILFIYPESGIKFSNARKPRVGNMYVGSLAISHQPIARYNLTELYTFSTQKSKQTEFSQHQITFLNRYLINLNTTLTASLNYNYYNLNKFKKRDSTYKNIIYYTPPNFRTEIFHLFKDSFKLKSHQHFFVSNISLSKKYRQLTYGMGLTTMYEKTFNIHNSLYYEKYEGKYMFDNQVISVYSYEYKYKYKDSTITKLFLQPEINLTYNFNHKISLGFDFLGIFSKADSLTPSFIIQPRFNHFISENFNYSISYFGRTRTPFSLNNATFVYTGTNEICHNFNIITNYRINTKTSIFITLQYQDIDDKIFENKYKFLSLFAGLKHIF